MKEKRNKIYQWNTDFLQEIKTFYFYKKFWSVKKQPFILYIFLFLIWNFRWKKKKIYQWNIRFFAKSKNILFLQKICFKILRNFTNFKNIGKLFKGNFEKNSKKFWNISQSLYLFIFNLKLSMKEKKNKIYQWNTRFFTRNKNFLFLQKICFKILKNFRNFKNLEYYLFKGNFEKNFKIFRNLYIFLFLI